MISPTTQTSLSDIQRFISLLYPADGLDDAWLVTSWAAGQNDFRSQWFSMGYADNAARFIHQQAQTCNTYLGLGLRHPKCQPNGRGTSADVCAIGGLWVELDHSAGVHSTQNLPTPTELLAFIHRLPFEPSLLIDSGGGFHLYLLFKELWIFEDESEQQKAALLLRRFQRTIQAQSALQGWKVDNTADLARVLRPAGTLNHKGWPKPVTFLEEHACRYNPSEIAELSWLATIEDTYTPQTPSGAFPLTIVPPIEAQCAWMAHCHADAGTLPEPEWYAMLSILGRCENGTQIAHDWSAPYPGYDHGETQKKIEHALAGSKPRTCANIRYTLDADIYCRDCPQWEHIKSPIVLGMPQRLASKEEQAQEAAITAREHADALLQQLSTLTEDERYDRFLDTLPALTPLDTISWMRLKKQLKVLVPTLNLNEIEKVRNELRRAAAQQAGQAAGNAQAQLSMALAQQFSGAYTYDITRQSWMRYDYGCWKLIDTKYIEQQILPFMDTTLHAAYAHRELSGVEKLLQIRLGQKLPVETPGWLPCRNGALHLASLTLHAHTPSRPFTWQLPYDYDPAATCPTIQRWLHEVMGREHGQVQVLRAYAKAVLTRRVDLQRYLELIGPGGTGKGTYTRLLQALVGWENSSAHDLKNLEHNRFELSTLEGKSLMVITDAERYGGPLNQLKAIIGQDFVRIEAKFKTQHTGITPVMVVIAAEEPIQSSDYTSGLTRRRLTVPFPRRRPPDSEVRDLLSWHQDQWQGDLAAEIPGCLNWVLALPDAAVDLLLRRTTEVVPALKDALLYSLIDTNPLADWANKSLIADGKEAVNVGVAQPGEWNIGYRKDDEWLYPHYRTWVDGTGGKPLSSRRFTGLLKDLFTHQLRLTTIEHIDDNKGSRFLGIRLRPPYDESTPLFLMPNTRPVTEVTHDDVYETAETYDCDGSGACEEFLHTISQGYLIPFAGKGKGGLYARENYPSQASLPSQEPLRSVTNPSQSFTGEAFSTTNCAYPIPEPSPPPCAWCGSLDRYKDGEYWRCRPCSSQ